MFIWNWIVSLNDFLGPVANIIQIATLVVAIYGTVDLFRRRRALKAALAKQAQKQQPGAMALAIGVGRSNEADVRRYLKTKGLDQLENTLEVVTHAGNLPEDEFLDFLVTVQKKRNYLSELEASELHVFFGGPVALGLGIGALLDNWIPVRVYTLNHGSGQYEFVYTLGKGEVLGMLNPKPETKVT